MDAPGLFAVKPEERYRFLAVIAPPPGTDAVVRRWKQLLRARIGGFSSSNTLPHITLFFADLPATCEEHVCAAMLRGCEGVRAFPLRLQGITHFPDRRTIYIDPVEKEAIATVRVPTAAHVRAYPDIRARGVHVTDHPHLTIAAGLKPKQFDEAWTMLAPHTFEAAWTVADILLLKRPLYQAGSYAPVRRFALEP